MHTVVEYDLYFPLGKQTDPTAARQIHLKELKKRLTEFFGGMTDFHHRAEGEWRVNGVVYRDEIVLLRMIGQDPEESRTFLRDVAERLAKTLGEQQILIIEREVKVLQ